jgi:hypothetical protein
MFAPRASPEIISPFRTSPLIPLYFSSLPPFSYVFNKHLSLMYLHLISDNSLVVIISGSMGTVGPNKSMGEGLVEC